MLGGLGSCGRPICCGTFLGDFQTVTIKMAKEQNLSLNPTKISGQCGRLMCCLKYEQEYYEQTLKKLPKVGKDIVTPDGVGVITEINAIKESVKVRIRTADDTFDLREYTISEVRRPGPEDSAAVREIPKARPPKRGARPAAEENSEAEADKPQRKRYPHQKAPKNLSTDQFLEKMETDTVGRRKKKDGEKNREKRESKKEAPVEQAAVEQAVPEDRAFEQVLQPTVAQDAPAQAEPEDQERE